MLPIIKYIVPFGLVKRRTERLLEQIETNRQTNLYKHLVEPNSIVFDIGANIGNRISAFLNCGAKIVAVEPQPDCVGVLRRTYGKRIAVVEAAVGANAGRLPIFSSGDTDTSASLSADFIAKANESKRLGNRAWDRKNEVDVITLDSLIERHGVPSFIKIDVEGFEYEVLRGLSQPINALSFEWTSDMPEAASRCIDYLVGLGMEHFQLSFGDSMLWAHKTSQNAVTMKQIVMLLGEEPTCFGDIYASRTPLTRRSP